MHLSDKGTRESVRRLADQGTLRLVERSKAGHLVEVALAGRDSRLLRLTLPAVTSNDIEGALQSIKNLLTLVEDHYDLPRTVLASDKAIENEYQQLHEAAAKA